MRAQLTHADDNQLGAIIVSCRIGQRKFISDLLLMKIQRGGKDDISQCGNRGHHFIKIGEAVDVAINQAQQGALPQLAQVHVEIVGVGGGCYLFDMHRRIAMLAQLVNQRHVCRAEPRGVARCMERAGESGVKIIRSWHRHKKWV